MDTTRDLWLLVARASVGVMFFLSGWGKVANPKRFAADFAAWGIPEPDLASTVTAWAELVLGALLVLGLLTRFAAAGLAVTMLGAIYYSVWPAAVEASTTIPGFLSQFFYSPEWLLLLVLLALAGAGPGRFALDEPFGIEARLQRR
ncbi:DoxX family protein [Tsukamurella tyrosinosolvens]|uniref:Putative oxidoreductase n=1 Tax=Tsukamurella tyrosinosolvens TaxID=57704 RepID=A0A1H5AGZ0_TSUTY|nr:DoxX family protein [Tsukamurella tyrosinosolvens]MEC4614797.1 DoxX family protein [Tsukamurella tyrosinosolvens]SED41659.1 putative oxidoreductase [Tsukamurella tyrosinosolvens]